MRLVQAQDIPFQHVSGHRQGTIEFKCLLQGEEQRPDNFEFSLVQTRGHYHTPRHRHNFDQVRLNLTGAMNYADGKDLRSGEVGYFPEGTRYGPQNIVGDPLTLVLQSGGASGEGFMSYRQLNEGHRALEKLGAFSKGAFRWDPKHRPSGKSLNQDGYEAIWEYVNGRELRYPEPRHTEPVVMHPDKAGDWTPAARGVKRKLLGNFSERRIEIEVLRMDAGVDIELGGDGAQRVYFARTGSGTANGARWREEAALFVACGERMALHSEQASEWFGIRMPEFSA